MKLFVFWNMEKTRFGRWFMEGFPAKYHAFFWMGFMTFTGSKDYASPSLVKHELIHHYQAEREGWFRWMVNYYRETFRNGYMGNKYEVEAYARMHEPMTSEEYALTGVQRRPQRRHWYWDEQLQGD